MFNNNKTSKGSIVLNSLAYWTLFVLAALLPISAITINNVSSLMTKIVVGGVFVLLAVLFFALSHMKSQELVIPKSLILASAWLIPIAYIFSTLFAGGDVRSFFGERLTMDSAIFMIIVMLALSVSAIVLHSPKRALGLYLAMLVSAVLLTFGEAVIFFGRDLVSSFNLQSVSLVGSLNDLGIYFGLIIIFILLSLILLPINRMMSVVLWVVLTMSTLFLMIVNLSALWWIVGAFALSFFVYTITDVYTKKSKNYKEISYASLAVLLIAVVFIFIPATKDNGETSITGIMATKADVGEFDVRPSWGTTVSIGSQSYAENGALLGSGPGTFYHNWAQFFPDSINITAFWLTDFFYGIGLIPTSIISTGLLGAFAWLVFLVVFLWRGTRGLLLAGATTRGDIIGYLRVTSFVAALYLWINAMIQVPSPVLVIYAALLTGVFIASLSYGNDVTSYLKFSFRSNPRVGFLATLVLTLVVLGSAGGVYGLMSRYSAEAQYERGETMFTQIDYSSTETAERGLDDSYNLVVDAVNIHEADVYYRFLSNLEVRRIALEMQKNLSPEELQATLEGKLSNAIGNALKATELDGKDYQNWANLGAVYQSTSVLGIDGVVESAIAAYDNALLHRPKSPSLYYAKALLNRSLGDNASAKENVQKAITLRNQYTDAIFLLAQIQIEEGDVENAIKSVTAITLFNPNNAVAFFQLGLLHYSAEDYINSVQTFERAVNINNEYANARYFLALANWKLGDNKKALENLRKVYETNQDNTEVAQMIKNMEEGKEPFAHLEEAPELQNINLPVRAVGDGAPLDLVPDIQELAE
jgi:tetratricopeptide (TPR) repeat protein